MFVENCHENQGKYYDVPTPHELSNESDWFMIKEVETFQITFLNDTLNCELYNCKECKNDLDKDDVICKNCLEGYILIENKCEKNCELGENEKCKTCVYKMGETDNCESCNDGYFIPNNTGNIQYYIKNCYKCEEGCLKCHGIPDETICDVCQKDFILSGDKCLKNCEIGEKGKCKTCNTEVGKINECLTCNEGYCLTNDKKCDICEGKKYFNESVIIKNGIEQNLIESWIELKGKIKNVKLVFKGTRDGDQSEGFYKKVEKIGPTLTIFETMKGRRFGAFIKVNWDRSKLNMNIKDTNAFMFSLDTKKYYPIKSGGDHAIRYRSVGDCQIFGGIIGDNYEEYIGLECHANYMSVKNCHENQGKYYDVPTPHELSNESDWFMIKEVETFQITFLNDTLNCE